MATDIAKSQSANPIKNGSVVEGCSPTGQFSLYNEYVKNEPTITDIENKYDNRFYNGIFVQLVGGQTVVGG